MLVFTMDIFIGHLSLVVAHVSGVVMMPMNEAQTRLCQMLAIMDDPWVERWAGNLGLYRQISLGPIQPDEETMGEFRARCIDTLAPQVATDTAADFIMSGYEIDIVSGDRV